MDDVRNDEVDPLPPRLYGNRDLVRLFGVSQETLRDWVRKGILPAPVRIGARAYWDPREIAALLADTHA